MTAFIGARKRERAKQKRLDAQAPKAGELAPDFCLRGVDGEEQVCLSDFRGQKPVALVFGSFT
jgi:hypothetical protein